MNKGVKIHKKYEKLEEKYTQLIENRDQATGLRKCQEELDLRFCGKKRSVIFAFVTFRSMEGKEFMEK